MKLPPERKPEETLVRLKPGQSIQVDGLVVKLSRIDGKRVWLETSRPAGPPVAKTIDKLSTPG